MRFCVISFEERSLMLAGKSQLYGVMVCREKENRLSYRLRYGRIFSDLIHSLPLITSL